MKNILGLDIGTSSIGWAVVKSDDNGHPKECALIGSRIIPTSADVLGKFESGQAISETASRRQARMMRRMIMRRQLRRSRLLRILHLLEWLPEHFDAAHCWEKGEEVGMGFQHADREEKIAWTTDATGQSVFLFEEAFQAMLQEFQHRHPQWTQEHLLPADWTLYYLRKKGLTQPLSEQELAWVLLSFNQKRGYQKVRGEEEEEKPTVQEELVETRVLDVTTPEGDNGKNTWYHLQLENGLVYKRKSGIPLFNMKDTTISVIVKREFEPDGTTPKRDKGGQPKYTISMLPEDDWKLRKKRTERDLANSQLTVGAFIYERLLDRPSEKIRGAFVHTVDRALYRQEMLDILNEQSKYHPQLSDKKVLEKCATMLYPSNHAHRQHLINYKSMIDLLVDDVLFYQRPLRSKKGLLERCSLERGAKYVDQQGKVRYSGIPCAARSNPYYQEFRIWQWVHNLKVLDRNTDADRTSEFLPDLQSRATLFEWLNRRKNVTADAFYKDFLHLTYKRGTIPDVVWNYPEDKADGFPAAETRTALLTAIRNAQTEGAPIPEAEDFLQAEYVHHNSKHKSESEEQQSVALTSQPQKLTNEYMLWHLLYSITDRELLEKALRKWDLGEAFVTAMLKVKPFTDGYGAYSEKALKKLLSVMRCGKYWQLDAVCREAKLQIEALENETLDSELRKRMNKEGQAPLESVEHCQGLPPWRASYLIYGRHSEDEENLQWKSLEEMQLFIRNFKHQSLRNPMVEKILLEALRVVHDVWQAMGSIDEIHVEMAREMAATADQRKKMSTRNAENESANLRIRQLLQEIYGNTDHQLSCENVRPYSPKQQELLRIYEEGALAQLSENDTDYNWISKITAPKAQPSSSELLKYRLWLEQKYRSPYTGNYISLTKLFSESYEIEHVIPKSRFYDDSRHNKVICETEINKEKNNLLAAEFIKTRGGEKIGNFHVLKWDAYERGVNDTFVGEKLKRKRQNLLAEEIPSDFTARQLNNTRYITRTLTRMLSAVVREDDEREAKSKNVVVCTGVVTDRLKKEWGLNDVWNEILRPRFERMNLLTHSQSYGTEVEKNGSRHFQTAIPIEESKGFSKKRLDHRHHAMDALVIACAQRGLVQFLNNESAGNDPQTYIAQRRKWTAYKGHADQQTGEIYETTHLKKPWPTFTQDARKALNELVVSFKHRERLITRTHNSYERFDDNGRKVKVSQKGNELWAIRQSLHKDTVHGRVKMQFTKSSPLAKALKTPTLIVNKKLRLFIQDLKQKGYSDKAIVAHFAAMNNQFEGMSVKSVECRYWDDNFTASRTAIDDSFTAKHIDKITDSGIRKILRNYLHAKGNDPKAAFSPEGLEELNANIAHYNDGKSHQPIKKVRLYESLGTKFQVGHRGNRSKKWVEAQKGTNLFFAIYGSPKGRVFETIPLNVAVERKKQGLCPVPEQDKDGNPLRFSLSPNDLVYVPSPEEMENENFSIHELRVEGIYKMVSSTKQYCLFVPHRIATVIADKKELEAQNKMERAVDFKDNTTQPMIKAVCWKLEVDRLGRIKRILR